MIAFHKSAKISYFRKWTFTAYKSLVSASCSEAAMIQSVYVWQKSHPVAACFKFAVLPEHSHPTDQKAQSMILVLLLF